MESNSVVRDFLGTQPDSGDPAQRAHDPLTSPLRAADLTVRGLPGLTRPHPGLAARRETRELRTP